MGVLLAIAVSLAGVPAGSASGSAGNSRQSGIPASARAALLRAATAIAARHGDSHPHGIQAVRTTHRKAERILCGDCESRLAAPDATVYVVAMRGRFNCNTCSPPRGRSRGPDTVITLQFVDPGDLRAFELEYGRRYPHLKALGTPVRL